MVPKTVNGTAMAESGIDKFSVAGHLFWNEDSNTAQHVCVKCTPLPEKIVRDLAITTWPEVLHQGKNANSLGARPPVYIISTIWVSSREASGIMNDVVKPVFGFEKEIQFDANG